MVCALKDFSSFQPQQNGSRDLADFARATRFDQLQYCTIWIAPVVCVPYTTSF